MDPAMLARIAPAVTVFFEENGPFLPDHASPLAIATMNADIEETSNLLPSGANIAAGRAAEELAGEDNLQGRTVTVRVTARDRGGAQTHRMAIIELTGDSHQPYWVRYAE
jgi:hypothetical protein